MPEYKFNSIYVSVQNMKRAVEFYEKLFDRKVDKMDERYSEFEFGKFSFGLYNPNIDEVEVTYGSNSVPVFEIEDIDKEYQRIKEFSPTVDDKILELPDMKLFQFKDTEGNILEVYAWK